MSAFGAKRSVDRNSTDEDELFAKTTEKKGRLGMRLRVLSFALFIGLTALSVRSGEAQPTAQNSARAAPAASIEGAPVTIAQARQYDITSRITRRTYRVMVSTPPMADAGAAYPVMYLLDGNSYFATATRTLARLSFNKIVAPAIIVGIGYPTDDEAEPSQRRFLDLTPSSSKRADGSTTTAPTGDSDAFLRFVEEEVKPFVAARYKVDSTRQSFYGYSLGGLAVLRSLFRNPTAFSTYIVSSPSIWWDHKMVLADEEAFSKRARAGELNLKILVTSAGDEQYRGEDPKQLAADARMVDNASELAARLGALNPTRVVVARAIFEGEVHVSAPPATLSRALRFALPLSPPQSP